MWKANDIEFFFLTKYWIHKATLPILRMIFDTFPISSIWSFDKVACGLLLWPAGWTPLSGTDKRGSGFCLMPVQPSALSDTTLKGIPLRSPPTLWPEKQYCVRPLQISQFLARARGINKNWKIPRLLCIEIANWELPRRKRVAFFAGWPAFPDLSGGQKHADKSFQSRFCASRFPVFPSKRSAG